MAPSARHWICWRRRASICIICVCARSRSGPKSGPSWSDMSRSSSWSRIATRRCASCLISEGGARPEKLQPVLHYDGMPIGADGRYRGVSAGCWRRERPHEFYAQAEGRPSRVATQRTGSDPQRLRRRHVHPVRRLRTRFDYRLHRPGLFRAFDRAAPGGQGQRHRLFVKDAGLFPQRVPRLQLGARAHARGGHRCQRRQPGSALHRCLRRRRFSVYRSGPVLLTPCGAISTCSTSSRTTASTV